MLLKPEPNMRALRIALATICIFTNKASGSSPASKFYYASMDRFANEDVECESSVSNWGIFPANECCAVADPDGNPSFSARFVPERRLLNLFSTISCPQKDVALSLNTTCTSLDLPITAARFRVSIGSSAVARDCSTEAIEATLYADLKALFDHPHGKRSKQNMQDGNFSLLRILTYDGNVLDSCLNWFMVFLSLGAIALPINAHAPGMYRLAWLPMLVFLFAFQIGLCLVEHCAGVSVVWSALTGVFYVLLTRRKSWIVTSTTTREWDVRPRTSRSTKFRHGLGTLLFVMAPALWVWYGTKNGCVDVEAKCDPVWSTVAHVLSVMLGILMGAAYLTCEASARRVGSPEGVFETLGDAEVRRTVNRCNVGGEPLLSG
jgi:hypothetical protein